MRERLLTQNIGFLYPDASCMWSVQFVHPRSHSCVRTAEHQTAEFVYWGYFGSFHLTRVMPVDAHGFVTPGHDPVVGVEPGTRLRRAFATLRFVLGC